MALLNNNALTLADWAKRQGEDGKTEAQIAELLSQTNEVLTDMLFMEGNLPTGHKTTMRTGLPAVFWRAINQGVPRGKSTTAQATEAVGMLEAYSNVDKDLAELNGNTAAFRLSEDSAFLEAMNQEMASKLFYGNPASDPRQFLGLAPRYSSLSAGNSQNILDAGGTGTDNTSVWLVCWGEQAVFGIYPKGSRAGLMNEDDGILTVYDENGNPYKAYQTHYQWKNGVVVKDWRYAVRISNIDVSDLVGGTGTQASTAATAIIKLMQKALYRIPNANMGRMSFYMNRSVHEGLSIQALDRTQNVLKINEGLNQFGAPHSWLSFQGVPLRKVDALLNTEARVV